MWWLLVFVWLVDSWFRLWVCWLVGVVGWWRCVCRVICEWVCRGRCCCLDSCCLGIVLLFCWWSRVVWIVGNSFVLCYVIIRLWFLFRYWRRSVGCCCINWVWIIWIDCCLYYGNLGYSWLWWLLWIWCSKISWIVVFDLLCFFVCVRLLFVLLWCNCGCGKGDDECLSWYDNLIGGLLGGDVDDDWWCDVVFYVVRLFVFVRMWLFWFWCVVLVWFFYVCWYF